jgi:long-subunit acyl-CoA synthetase (AMP-forming)
MKGPVVTKGYYKNLQATKDSFVDGWFCTGDIAIWKNGLPYIVDRKKVCFLLLDWILLTQEGTH